MKAALALVAAMLASGLHSATGEAAGTLLGSSNVPVAAGNSIAAAPAPVLVGRQPGIETGPTWQRQPSLLTNRPSHH